MDTNFDEKIVTLIAGPFPASLLQYFAPIPD
jgi:hypothetical protein